METLSFFFLTSSRKPGGILKVMRTVPSVGEMEALGGGSVIMVSSITRSPSSDSYEDNLQGGGYWHTLREAMLKKKMLCFEK